MSAEAPIYADRKYHNFGMGLWGNPEDVSDGIFAQVETNLSVAPPAIDATSFYGRYTRIEYSGTGGFSGTGHLCGLESRVVMNASAQTVASMVGLRARCDVTVGLLTVFTGVMVEMPVNAGSMTSYIGMEVKVPVGTVTNEVGIVVRAMAGVSSARALQLEVAAAAARHNLFISGTAVNFLQGALRVGADVDMGCLIGSEDGIAVKDGIAEPTTPASYACIYVDTADGDLKVKFGDDFVAVIAADS